MTGLGFNPRVFNNGMNAVAERVEHCIEFDCIVPVCLGMIVAQALDVNGAGVALIQGACLAEYILVIHEPLNRYIEEHQGEGNGQMHAASVRLLRAVDGIGAIATIVIPTLFMKCFYRI
jgi:hypothetical protein